MNASAAKKSVIEIRQFSVRKGAGVICDVPKLQVAAGERVVIVGDNGSGKTTLLRVLAGLEREFGGACQISLSTEERVFVHQSPCLFRGTVLFNAMYGLAARGVPRAEREQTAREWLAALGVAELEKRRCANLSGGERRRVSLARALAVKPAMLLLDEPFAELDEEGIDVVSQAIASLTDTTVLITSPTPLPKEMAATQTLRLAARGSVVDA